MSYLLLFNTMETKMAEITETESTEVNVCQFNTEIEESKKDKPYDPERIHEVLRYERSSCKIRVPKERATRLIGIAYKFVDGHLLYGACVFKRDHPKEVFTKEIKAKTAHTARENLKNLPVRILFPRNASNMRIGDLVVNTIRKAMQEYGTCSRGIKKNRIFAVSAPQIKHA